MCICNFGNGRPLAVVILTLAMLLFGNVRIGETTKLCSYAVVILTLVTLLFGN